MRELRTDEQQAVSGGTFWNWGWKKPDYHKPSPPKHSHHHHKSRHGC